ncbi:MAG: S-methyl-5-thioribose-1-phosphate isomerase [Chloroflexota bacterium]|nr:S-methyl-5-thioribose-1-phosphate isomerase [Chloroflexota bacterium]
MCYTIPALKTIEWRDAGPEVWLIDQTRLPLEEVIVRCSDYRQVAEAIRSMQVRGAPAIGVAAAMGVALGAQSAPDDPQGFIQALDEVCATLRQTRPTAVNLFWGIDRMRHVAHNVVDRPVETVKAALAAAAVRLASDDEAGSRRIGEFGSVLFSAGDGVLTHCNAGSLACVEYGTALAPLRTAHEQGKGLHVFVDETRPFLQGSRLTAWELLRAGIDCTLITDNMAAHFMGQGQVQKVIVGADRIAANGDVANKIGTYGLAILAAAHAIPFYVAAPTSTIDLAMPSGAGIPIEERDPAEVTHFRGQQVAPDGVRAAHPAFDITPSRYVTAIITDVGVARPPYVDSLLELAERARETSGETAGETAA